MKTDRIKELLQKYYDANTSLTEEEELRKAFKSNDLLEESLRADGELFLMMTAMASETTQQELQGEVEDEKVIPFQSNTTTGMTWSRAIAAGISILIIGVFAGWIIGNQGANDTEIAGLQKDISEMKQLVALTQLQKESASDRIMATYEIKKLDSAVDEILNALIYTFYNDKNANVKNAAAEALFKFGNQDKVRKAFIKGLSNESDPVLQIKLIDMLVGLDEKRALPKLQEMTQQDSQMKIVKQKAAQGIGKLL